MILSERHNEANDLSEIALFDKKKTRFSPSCLAAWLPFLLRIIWIGLSLVLVCSTQLGER